MSVGQIMLTFILIRIVARTDLKYHQFGIEIKQLGRHLQLLRKIYANAVRERELRLRRPSRDDRTSAFHTLPELTGDFQRTLEECDRLLRDHSRFQRNKAGFVENVRWHIFGTERDVNSLRERIQIHSTKILVITKPFELTLLSELSEDVWRIRGAVEEIRGLTRPGLQRSELPVALPAVPSGLDARFLEALSINKPKSFQGIAHFPLKEGFDALVYHFGASTVNFKPGHDFQRTPDVQQYLNLIKSRWILQKTKDSSLFNEEGPESLWARCIEEAEMDILSEYKRFDSGQLVAPEDEVISQLSINEFSIWIGYQATDVPPVLTDERPFEEKILEIALPNPDTTRQSRLVFFRRSDHELRIVRSTTDAENDFFSEAESYEMSVYTTRFIPAYAVPGYLASTNSVFLQNRGVQTERAYELKCLADVHDFQRAVTGFKVVHDAVNVHWRSFKSRWGKTEREQENGRVQIWQAEPFPKVPRPSSTEDQLPVRSLSVTSTEQFDRPTSYTTESLAETFSSGTNTSLVIRSDDGSTGDKVRGLLLPPPIIAGMIIYTKYKGKYTFLHLQLGTDVFINPRSETRCEDVVIESKRGKLHLKRYCAQFDSEEGLSTWDPLPLITSGHPDSEQLESWSNVNWLCLSFSTFKEKDEFRKSFENICRLSDQGKRVVLLQQERLNQEASYSNGQRRSSKSK